MQEYFADSKLEEPEDRRFRDILSAYVRSLYPVNSVMPIGYKYQDFPFIVFRSYSLQQSREKIFTDKYLLSSNELNVLNLILSKKIDWAGVAERESKYILVCNTRNFFQYNDSCVWVWWCAEIDWEKKLLTESKNELTDMNNLRYF